MVQSFRETIGVKPSTANVRDSVLVIIDAQNEYAEGQLKTENVESTRKEISGLLERYREASGEIVHVVHQVPAGAPVFTPDTNLAKEFPELEPKSGEKVIGKNYPGSFTGTDLDEHLQGLKDVGKKVVLTGYMAHVCVSTTARQAAEKGYDVVLAEGAIGDRAVPGATGAELVKTTLIELGDAFGSVVKASDIK